MDWDERGIWTIIFFFDSGVLCLEIYGRLFFFYSTADSALRELRFLDSGKMHIYTDALDKYANLSDARWYII